ncbi:MAG: hypothetical protein ACE5E6_10930, partial [Phycisphaerae bacterium]
KWLHPYVNVALSATLRDALLPGLDEIGDALTDAVITTKLGYSGVTTVHEGPIPIGVLAVPTMFAVGAGGDDGAQSDLARERLASQRLKVLYHHCVLFRKDQARWPAEVAELDGYVDFAGHPELLRFPMSSKKQRAAWVKAVFGTGTEDADEQEEADDDAETVLDDSLYVVDWGGASWTLGYAPDTLDHLDALYIDQDGRIHRTVKPVPKTTPPADGGLSDDAHDASDDKASDDEEDGSAVKAPDDKASPGTPVEEPDGSTIESSER